MFCRASSHDAISLRTDLNREEQPLYCREDNTRAQSVTDDKQLEKQRYLLRRETWDDMEKSEVDVKNLQIACSSDMRDISPYNKRNI